MILSYRLILPMSQLKTATDDVTNWVTHRIFNTYIIVLIFYSKLMRNVTVMAIFNTI